MKQANKMSRRIPTVGIALVSAASLVLSLSGCTGVKVANSENKGGLGQSSNPASIESSISYKTLSEEQIRKLEAYFDVTQDFGVSKNNNDVLSSAASTKSSGGSTIQWSESVLTDSGASSGTAYDSPATSSDRKSAASSSSSSYTHGNSAATSTPSENGSQRSFLSHLWNTEEYQDYEESGFKISTITPLSTFGADVDTASYANFRGKIMDYQGSDMTKNRSADSSVRQSELDRALPADGTVLTDSFSSGMLRYEEMLNYFTYDTGDSQDGKAFTAKTEIAECPWNKDHDLLMVNVKANREDVGEVRSNFVYLIDVSGSMAYKEKIGLACESFAVLSESLTSQDRVSIVTYSGDSQTLLDSCPGNDKDAIWKALLQAEKSCIVYGGGTNGSGGIQAAYDCAQKNFMKDGNNRVIIASDGDMNLGLTSTGDLTKLIEEKKESGVFLTALGFGSGNYSDTNMEQIADRGNGNYFYIDSLREVDNVLRDKMVQNFITVAKDVKFQLEFNPVTVKEYRLMGYDNRLMAAEDFADDAKDGGEVGAGAQVCVVYEIVPVGAPSTNIGSSLKYQVSAPSANADGSGDLANLAIRYKEPSAEKSVLEEQSIKYDKSDSMSDDMSFASGVIETTMVINNSKYKNDATLETAKKLVAEGMGDDLNRKEFAVLLNKLR